LPLTVQAQQRQTQLKAASSPGAASRLYGRKALRPASRGKGLVTVPGVPGSRCLAPLATKVCI